MQGFIRYFVISEHFSGPPCTQKKDPQVPPLGALEVHLNSESGMWPPGPIIKFERTGSGSASRSLLYRGHGHVRFVGGVYLPLPPAAYAVRSTTARSALQLHQKISPDPWKPLPRAAFGSGKVSRHFRIM